MQIVKIFRFNQHFTWNQKKMPAEFSSASIFFQFVILKIYFSGINSIIRKSLGMRSPAFTFIFFILAVKGISMRFCIFMDSSISRGSPSLTTLPSLTKTSIIVPGIYD